MPCFESVLECSKVETVILGTRVNHKTCFPFQALVWQMKKAPLLSGEGSVNTKNWGFADSTVALPTVLCCADVTPATSVSQNF